MRLACAALLTIATTVSVAKTPRHDDVSFDPQAFAEQRDALESEIATGERYRSIAKADKERVYEALERLAKNLAEVTAVSQLSEAKRLSVFNDQQLINTLLTRAAADSRVVCTRETPVGTRLPIKTCKTVGERRLERENAQESLRDTFGSQMVDRSTGGN
jgi:hypothetical protein